ncbi:glycoside hydrolase family 65 protein [Jatrophihabitans sp.]|uniref:glycoside hydrolase family 65 protein n=1 Tax=Jatrophihabitans sp. TaxID=1932789 RepID=UPI002BF241E4|nr:glycosyl hydrolase family 65 protein [Jatrophihabitans sp.]
MITDARFPIEPWQVRELRLDLEMLAQSESVFALSNGHIGVRGTLDEGDPSGLPGTYLNSFYEARPLPYAEAGYGYPESGQTVVNVTDGKLIRLLVDDEPFDMRYGTPVRHERVLDLRTGTLRRSVEWISPAGTRIRVRSERLVSFTQRAILAIRYQVEALDAPVRVVVQSELVANEELPKQSGDPRVAAVLERPLEAVEHSSSGNRSALLHRTRVSQLRMAAAVDHVLDSDTELDSHTYVQPDWSRTTVGARLAAGQTLTVTKFVAYGWSSQRSIPALRDQVDAALSAALHTGWDELLAEQRRYVDDFWDGADVELDGDDAVQQAVRFGLFHVLQAGARAEQRAIPAKGLTGPGYDGHAFWDTESFVLPVLTATAPKAAADALRWRHSTLDLALERARVLQLAGAAFPWRTIRGQETSAYWPAGTAAFHINADIALAAVRYVQWTGDEDFEAGCALPLLVQTARLWHSLGYAGTDGRFHLDGVTGPDEYSAIVDDNTYTNLMAARNLSYAADAARRWPDQAGELGVDEREIEAWQAAADTMAVPYDAERGIPEQDRGYHRHEVWDFAASAASEGYPLLLRSPYFQIYRKQVVKQADLVLALHWCGDSFSLEEKAGAFGYYEQITVRDSSLSACSQAVIAAEVGHLDLAHAYLGEAALMDLRDLEHNTRDGVHVASLAGAWIALVCGFGGMRDHGGRLSFAPRLPAAISRLSFAVRWRGCKVRVEVHADRVRYAVVDGSHGALSFDHHGSQLSLDVGAQVELPIPPLAVDSPTPSQPAGRAPGEAFRIER